MLAPRKEGPLKRRIDEIDDRIQCLSKVIQNIESHKRTYFDFRLMGVHLRKQKLISLDASTEAQRMHILQAEMDLLIAENDLNVEIEAIKNSKKFRSSAKQMGKIKLLTEVPKTPKITELVGNQSTPKPKEQNIALAKNEIDVALEVFDTPENSGSDRNTPTSTNTKLDSSKMKVNYKLQHEKRNSEDKQPQTNKNKTALKEEKHPTYEEFLAAALHTKDNASTKLNEKETNINKHQTLTKDKSENSKTIFLLDSNEKQKYILQTSISDKTNKVELKVPSIRIRALNNDIGTSKPKQYCRNNKKLNAETRNNKQPKTKAVSTQKDDTEKRTKYVIEKSHCETNNTIDKASKTKSTETEEKQNTHNDIIELFNKYKKLYASEIANKNKLTAVPNKANKTSTTAKGKKYKQTSNEDNQDKNCKCNECKIPYNTIDMNKTLKLEPPNEEVTSQDKSKTVKSKNYAEVECNRELLETKKSKGLTLEYKNTNLVTTDNAAHI